MDSIPGLRENAICFDYNGDSYLKINKRHAIQASIWGVFVCKSIITAVYVLDDKLRNRLSLLPKRVTEIIFAAWSVLEVLSLILILLGATLLANEITRDRADQE